MSIKDEILKLTNQLYPTGRAFRMTNFGYRKAVHSALADSEAQAFDDAASILDVIIPDNENFTSADATDWERRLGLITNLSVPLADRKAAILRKMQSPGVNPAKGHYLYMQDQLQAAGFDVYVHENLFPLYPTGIDSVAPNSIYGNANFKPLRFGAFRFGQRNFGGYYNNKIANSIYQVVDNNFNVGNSFRATFFISGATLGTYANVLASREQEFRQLILNLKQVQDIGFLFINYI